jgi:protein-L-isoaspartate(D-aspartate) O-methyltransferase
MEEAVNPAYGIARRSMGNGAPKGGANDMTETTLHPDFAHARNLMVDGQLRPTNVNDQRVLDAMRTLPRERFVPSHLAGLAYIDDDLEIAPGRFMLKPLVLARLIQLAAPVAGEAALVVGAGSGYGAAVLAACGAQVIALEEDAALVDLGRAALAESNAGVTLELGSLADGWPGRAPYDVVVIEGAVRAIPERLARQVAATGRLVTVLAPAGGGSYAVIAEPSAGGLAVRPAFDATAPLLPALRPVPSFAF